MAGVLVAGFVKPLELVRTTTLPGADATVLLLPIWSALGWGTLRVYAEADVAVTLNILQKERLGTFRRTDQDTIPAGPPALTADYLIAAELVRIEIVTTTAPVRFALFAALYP